MPPVRNKVSPDDETPAIPFRATFDEFAVFAVLELLAEKAVAAVIAKLAFSAFTAFSEFKEKFAKAEVSDKILAAENSEKEEL